MIRDARSDSPTADDFVELVIGEHRRACAYRIPPGVVYGYRCMNGPARVISLTSGIYDPHDEVRVAHGDPAIRYDWSVIVR